MNYIQKPHRMVGNGHVAERSKATVCKTVNRWFESSRDLSFKIYMHKGTYVPFFYL